MSKCEKSYLWIRHVTWDIKKLSDIIPSEFNSYCHVKLSLTVCRYIWLFFHANGKTQLWPVFGSELRKGTMFFFYLLLEESWDLLDLMGGCPLETSSSGRVIQVSGRRTRNEIAGACYDDYYFKSVLLQFKFTTSQKSLY